MSIGMAVKRKGKPLNVWIESDLRKAIDEACKRNRRKLNEEVSIALEEYLEKLDLWPPPLKKVNGSGH
jgi:hypothetical protein